MVPKNVHITARHVLYCASAAENLAAGDFAAADMVFGECEWECDRRRAAVRVFLSSTAAADSLTAATASAVHAVPLTRASH